VRRGVALLGTPPGLWAGDKVVRRPKYICEYFRPEADEKYFFALRRERACKIDISVITFPPARAQADLPGPRRSKRLPFGWHCLEARTAQQRKLGSMSDSCFVVGSLAPSLRPVRPAGAAFQNAPICMGRRSDKIKNKKEKTTRARTKVQLLVFAPQSPAHGWHHSLRSSCRLMVARL
jgi:hypothetical protein